MMAGLGTRETISPTLQQKQKVQQKLRLQPLTANLNDVLLKQGYTSQH